MLVAKPHLGCGNQHDSLQKKKGPRQKETQQTHVRLASRRQVLVHASFANIIYIIQQRSDIGSGAKKKLGSIRFHGDLQPSRCPNVIPEYK